MNVQIHVRIDEGTATRFRVLAAKQGLTANAFAKQLIYKTVLKAEMKKAAKAQR